MIGPICAGVDLAATAVALAAIGVLHVLPTGLSPLHDPVSQYGITRYRLGYRVLTIALGVAGLATAGAVAVAYPPTGRTAVVVLLVVFGLCRLAISWWPMDAPGRPRTTRGSVHIALAIGAFLAAAIAANRMHHAVGQFRQRGGAVGGVAYLAFWLIVAGLAGQVLARRAGTRHRYYGAAERLVYAGIFVLLATAGLAVI